MTKDPILKKLSRFRAVLRFAFFLAVVTAGTLLILKEEKAIFSVIAVADPALLQLAFAAALAHVVTSYLGWRVLINEPIAHEKLAARMFFLAQLGKYLPGGIWSFLAIADYARDAYVTPASALSASIIALFASLIAGAFLSALFFPILLSSAIGISMPLFLSLGFISTILVWLGFIHLAPKIAMRTNTTIVIEPRALLASSGASLLTWLLGGVSLWLIAASIGCDFGDVPLPTFGAIYAASWLVGFAVFIAPAGLGAREGTMVALLTTITPLSEAIMIALIVRIMVTLADFLLGSLFIFVRPEKDVQAEERPLHQEKARR